MSLVHLSNAVISTAEVLLVTLYIFCFSINEKLKIGKSTETSVSLVYNEVVIGISFKSADSASTFIEAIESIQWR